MERIDLSDKLMNSGNNAKENLELAKQALIRATENPVLSKYITKEAVEKVMQTIKLCKTDEEYAEEYEKHALDSMKRQGKEITKEDIEYFKELATSTMAAQDYDTNEILLRPETDVDTIVHEAIHGIAIKDGVSGINKIGEALIEEKENGWEDLKKFDITVLDESITEFITKLVIPEREGDSAYAYGVDIIENYHNVCSRSSSSEKLFEAYFNKDQKALKDIANDFNSVDENTWDKIVKSMRRHQLANMDIKYIKYLQNAMSKSELKQIFVELSNNLEKRREFTPRDIGKATINASTISKMQAQNIENRNIEEKGINK